MALSTWLTARYTPIKTLLAWSDFTSIIEDALELYGVATEGLATDTAKLHALAVYALWVQAKADVSLDIDFTADDRSFKRSQKHAMIEKNLSDAILAAFPYLSTLQVDVSELTISDRDPYDFSDERDDIGAF